MNSAQKRQQRSLVRDAKLKDRFESLSNKKENGVRKYSREYVLSVLSDEFNLATKTIEDIIFNRVPRARI